MADQHSPRFLAIISDARHRIQEISAPALKEKIENGGSFALIDVREANEFAAGRLPGAQHLCKGVIERDIEHAVPDDGTEIVLYCGGGFRSALAADSLQKMGYTRVLSLAGGWSGWLKAGYPTAQQ